MPNDPMQVWGHHVLSVADWLLIGIRTYTLVLSANHVQRTEKLIQSHYYITTYCIYVNAWTFKLRTHSSCHLHIQNNLQAGDITFYLLLIDCWLIFAHTLWFFQQTTYREWMYRAGLLSWPCMYRERPSGICHHEKVLKPHSAHFKVSDIYITEASNVHAIQ